MALELARPGTLYFATNGDAPSKKYLNAAVADGMQGGSIYESRRPVNLPAALQTTTSGARAAANLQPNDQMQAHHLIPANVWAKELNLATLASEAGWKPDSITNVIPLPANEATQANLAAKDGVILPIHSSRHPDYDTETLGRIIIEREEYRGTMSRWQARAIFLKRWRCKWMN
jgi:hypothetical protein